MKVKVPKQEIKVDHHVEKGCTAGSCKGDKGHKRDFDVTHFALLGEDGTVYGTCQAMGDHKAKLEAAMSAADNALEIKSIEHQEQWNRWDVKLEGSWAGGGGAGGGGYKKPWTSYGPKYKGRPSTQAEFVATSTEIFNAFYDMIVAKVGAVGDNGLRAQTVESARSLTAQFWMGCVEGTTYPTGKEPAPQASVPGSTGSGGGGQATTEPAATTPPASAEARAEVVIGFQAQLEAVTTLEGVEEIRKAVNAAAQQGQVDQDQAVALYTLVFKRKGAIAKGQK